MLRFFKIIFPILLGLSVAWLLFTAGDADDSPGLSFIGLSLGFLLIMRGMYHTGIIKKGLHIPIILSVFGIVALIFPVVLWLDNEIRGLSTVTLLGVALGIALLSAATILVKRRH